jgi:hypothetical protein
MKKALNMKDRSMKIKTKKDTEQWLNFNLYIGEIGWTTADQTAVAGKERIFAMLVNGKTIRDKD